MNPKLSVVESQLDPAKVEASLCGVMYEAPFGGSGS